MSRPGSLRLHNPRRSQTVMELSLRLVLVWCLAACISAVHAVFEVETGGVRVVHPATGAKRFDMALANFGVAKYGAQLVGQLIYPSDSLEYGQAVHTCEPVGCNYGCAPFNESKPELKIVKQPGQHYIMLLDRGPKDERLQRPCYFLDKVYHAQLAGADAVLVINDHAGDLSTAVAPKDEGSKKELRSLSISGGLISQENGNGLKELLKKGPVTVALNWTDVLPRQDMVEWEFWTNSNDECGATCDTQRKFVKDFKTAGKWLELKSLVQSTPHYLTWVCQYAADTPEECQSQCIRGGRYCCPDPDDNIQEGYSGRDVLLMNLRSVCFHRVASARGQPWLWWDFVDRLGDMCSMQKQQYTPECAAEVFKAVAGPQVGDDTGRKAWDACATIDQLDLDEPVPMLEAELKVQTGNNSESTVAILPTVRVNHRQYRGSLDAPSIVRALCAAFPVGREPSICNEAWVSDNECTEGSEGWQACSSGSAGSGRTRCINTFAAAGYKCECGRGFMKIVDKQTGAESCTDINECLMSQAPWTKDDCKCERCTCVNMVGGYKCTGPLPNYCTKEYDYGGCWHDDRGPGPVVHACVDTMRDYRQQAALGWVNETSKPVMCQCPPCWRPTGASNGGCERYCGTSHCQQLHGDQCDNTQAAAPQQRRAGTGALAMVLGIVVGMAATAGSVYGIYSLYLRNRMNEDVRSILEEYVPLNSAPSIDPNSLMAMGSERRSSSGSVHSSSARAEGRRNSLSHALSLRGDEQI